MISVEILYLKYLPNREKVNNLDSRACQIRGKNTRLVVCGRQN